ncbi:MAG: hypothetical protein CME34_13340 [Gordonia sp.]|uniref:hypothetical protein n=1 Tax=Gordonia sp. (in: high G+C Gram-positive bacteria) TaxID=84139 RepID=UPI000C3CFCCB|nr:hypothetical protein [Gordonia sp. (in: high G+C Gram-positive bacteria)]MAU82830.1 hypothetical protein [Gordonia sp. (in: high G+C Gram-positive bacteria)]
MTIATWGLSTGPATWVGIHGRENRGCRIIRFRRDCVVVRWDNGDTDTVHPDDLRQEVAR